MKRSGIPGLGMALVKDGRLVYAQSYGLARTGPVEEATAQTLFRIGSNSKITAAVAMIQLIEQGALTTAGQPVTMNTRIFRDILNGPAGVGNALGAYNPQLDAITVRQVLQHIAGFGGGINPITNTEAIAVALGIQRTPTCAETVRWMLDKPLATAPGTTYSYYNTGPCIIAAAVEVLSGQTFENFIRDNLFAPYGIQNLVVRSADLFADRAAGEAVHYSTISDRLSGAEFVRPRFLENGDVFHNGAVGGGHGWYVIKTADDVIWTVFANASDNNDLNELNQIMIAAYNAAKPAIDASTSDHSQRLGIVPVFP